MKDLSEGNIYKNFILFAIPLVGAGLFSQFYSVFDTVIAGKFLGENGLAAIGATAPFITFVSSMSTMHRLGKFYLDSSYNEYVDQRMITIMYELQEAYNAEPTKENYLRLLYSNPAGFELTARLTTNYRCLRNVYEQRKQHRLPEWREFCKWIETLPYAKELILN